ncbi:hypothetical protein H7R52_14835 [Weissella confusa]|uniref:Uncharacterized protein n=1 Tax=Weissella confusa TaxID=1583 RepID=A0A923STZ6_WEICO|nr:hypothetical protein [Weissella confusa]
MPKMLRVIIIGFAVAALGIMLSVIGYVNGGQNSLVWRDGHFVLPQEKAINQKFDTIKTIELVSSKSLVQLRLPVKVGKLPSSKEA